MDSWASWYVANVVLVVLWRNGLEIAHEEGVGIALSLEELSVVLDVVDAGEYFLEIAQSELLFFKIDYESKVVLSGQGFLTAEELAHKLAKVGLSGEVI